MINISMKHLRYFDALARQKHFGRAAEVCSITQPALSQQIKELEAMIGAPLVERTARKIWLTALGEDFAERTRLILNSVDELEDLVRVSQGAFSGKLRLGVIPTIAPYLLPQVIKALSSRYPNLDLHPREAVTQTLVDDLMEARLDVAILALPISNPALREFSLFEEDFFLVRRAEDAQKPFPNQAQLKELRLLLLEEGHCFRDQALSFCAAMESEPRDLMEGSSLSTLVQMVGAGIGITVIPEMALPLETRSADVSIARFPAPCPSRTIGMIWRKSNPLAEQFMQIAAVVRKVYTPGEYQESNAQKTRLS